MAKVTISVEKIFCDVCGGQTTEAKHQCCKCQKYICEAHTRLIEVRVGNQATAYYACAACAEGYSAATAASCVLNDFKKKQVNPL